MTVGTMIAGLLPNEGFGYYHNCEYADIIEIRIDDCEDCQS